MPARRRAQGGHAVKIIGWGTDRTAGAYWTVVGASRSNPALTFHAVSYRFIPLHTVTYRHIVVGASRSNPVY